tara:strand:- start:83 stop:217 length:135 start_codon:yes stop_codon:yes gene_type:complete
MDEKFTDFLRRLAREHEQESDTTSTYYCRDGEPEPEQPLDFNQQ